MNKDILDHIRDEVVRYYEKQLEDCQQELNKCQTELESYKTRCHRHERVYIVYTFGRVIHAVYFSRIYIGMAIGGFLFYKFWSN